MFIVNPNLLFCVRFIDHVKQYHLKNVSNQKEYLSKVAEC